MRYTPRGQGNLFDGADIIREKLRERYLTQRDLADAIHMDQAKLSNVLNGHRRPTKAELQDISTSLGIDISEWRKQSDYVNRCFPMIGNNFD